MNKTVLIGNLTRDAELSTTTNGISVARFTVAVQRKFKNANGEYETDFINCVAWRNTAENLAKYTSKGSKVGVAGSIQTRSYEAADGTKRYVTEVIADEVEFLNTKQEKGTELEIIEDAELPF